MTSVEKMILEVQRRLEARLDDLARRQKLIEARLGDGDLTPQQQVDIRELAAQIHGDVMRKNRNRRSQ